MTIREWPCNTYRALNAIGSLLTRYFFSEDDCKGISVASTELFVRSPKYSFNIDSRSAGNLPAANKINFPADNIFYKNQVTALFAMHHNLPHY